MDDLMIVSYEYSYTLKKKMDDLIIVPYEYSLTFKCIKYSMVYLIYGSCIMCTLLHKNVNFF